MRLVNGSPDFDAVSKALKANLRVFAEPLCHVVVQPSAFASKREWQIVMEQRNVGLYAIFEAAINDPIIKSIPSSFTSPIPVGMIRLHEREKR